MRPTTDEPSAHRITPAELGLLTQVVRDVSRARRLSSDDAAEFAQTVHVKLLERKYDVLLTFSRRQFPADLSDHGGHTPVPRLAQQRAGKMATSAAARRGGPSAIALERLIVGDGYTIDEAVEIVAQDSRRAAAICEPSPNNCPAEARRRMVGRRCVGRPAWARVSDPVAEDDRRRADAIARRLLARALE